MQNIILCDFRKLIIHIKGIKANRKEVTRSPHCRETMINIDNSQYEDNENIKLEDNLDEHRNTSLDIDKRHKYIILFSDIDYFINAHMCVNDTKDVLYVNFDRILNDLYDNAYV